MAAEVQLFGGGGEGGLLVANQRKDVLATNALARALMAPMFDDPGNQNNLARFTFFSPASRSFYPDWEQGANSIVASLRTAAGRHPHDKNLTDLIGELVTRSNTFRLRWAAHDVRFHRSGTKCIHHPEVDDLEFTFEGLELPDQPGWMMFTYTAAAGSPTEERGLTPFGRSGGCVSRPVARGSGQ